MKTSAGSLAADTTFRADLVTAVLAHLLRSPPIEFDFFASGKWQLSLSKPQVGNTMVKLAPNEHRVQTSQPAFLLTMGSYLGTLAAARELGRNGIQVHLADSDSSCQTAWSRYVQKIHKCPPLEDRKRYADWLLEFGRKHPGFVLYPSSDDVAWMIAQRYEEFSKTFRLFLPCPSAVMGLLNKASLGQFSRDLGIATPAAWYPENEADVAELSTQISYPVLLKPRTQTGLSVHVKGLLCASPSELIAKWKTYRERFPYRPDFLVSNPGIDRLMIQSFLPEASQNILSVAGFYDQKIGKIAFRASRKSLQRPVTLGVGLCFEAVSPPQSVINAICQLCEATGYGGVFEAEFIATQNASSPENQYLLIDFNPRFYGQMGFEIFRQLPLARLVYYGALGDQENYLRLWSDIETQNWDHNAPMRSANVTILHILLFCQWLGQKLSTSNYRKWRGLLKDTQNVHDMVGDPTDPRPLRAELWGLFKGLLRHPRGTFRAFFGR